MDTFSKGQKLIARYISEHYDKVAFMTASRLGATVGVSESTVVRFATEIGYTGYPELQQAMQEMIRNKLTSVQRMQVTEGRLREMIFWIPFLRRIWILSAVRWKKLPMRIFIMR